MLEALFLRILLAFRIGQPRSQDRKQWEAQKVCTPSIQFCDLKAIHSNYCDNSIYLPLQPIQQLLFTMNRKTCHDVKPFLFIVRLISTAIPHPPPNPVPLSAAQQQPGTKNWAFVCPILGYFWHSLSSSRVA